MKEKFGIKGLILTITFLFSSFGLAHSTDAYTLQGGSYQNPPATSLNWWYDSSISSMGYVTYANHGSNAWDPSIHVEVTSTSYVTSSELRWYADSFDNLDVYALNFNYDSNNNWCNNCSYKYSHIRIKVPKFKDATTAEKYEVAAHEIGHSLGLGESSSSSEIMWQGNWFTDFTGYTTPRSGDYAGINAIY